MSIKKERKKRLKKGMVSNTKAKDRGLAAARRGHAVAPAGLKKNGR